MIERLRMQEVQQVILSVPEGAIINGGSYKEGEPVIIVDKPGLSNLNFLTTNAQITDGRGFIGASGMTNRLDFTINEGSILYGAWSYIHGINEALQEVELKGTEWLIPDNNRLILSTSSEPINLILYGSIDGKLVLLTKDVDYDIILEDDKYIINLLFNNYNNYFVVYNYKTIAQTTNIKQIHNNLFCSLDIYMDAVDMVTEEHHEVCIHCDKVQVFMDLMISTNNSQQVSFTPIRICSIPVADQQRAGINKDVAKIMVI